MTPWSDADEVHITRLRAFDCVPPVLPVAYQPRWRYKQPPHWLLRVRQIVRTFAPPLQLPDVAKVAEAGDGSIEAVMVLIANKAIGEPVVLGLAVAARSISARGRGLGDAIIECFYDECDKVLENLGLSEAPILAEIHKSNRPMRALLKRHGWQPAVRPSNDPEYTYWGGVVEARPRGLPVAS